MTSTCILKSVDSNCFALLELISTAQRTEAQLFAMKYVPVKQSIFIKSCKPRQECSKCSKSSERCTRRAARVRAKVRVLNLTTLLALGSIILIYVYMYILYQYTVTCTKVHDVQIATVCGLSRVSELTLCMRTTSSLCQVLRQITGNQETFVPVLVRDLRGQTHLHLEMFAIEPPQFLLILQFYFSCRLTFCDFTPIAKAAKESGSQRVSSLQYLKLWTARDYSLANRFSAMQVKSASLSRPFRCVYKYMAWVCSHYPGLRGEI